MAKKVGRPEKYTQDLADKVCHRIAEGYSMRTVCKPDDMPGLTTVFKWIRTKEEFAKQYARATEERTEAMAEETIDISDDSLPLAQQADPKASGAIVQAQRLRVDTRKWLMSKMKPKKYGDKVDVTSDGKAIKGNTIMFGNFEEKE